LEINFIEMKELYNTKDYHGLKIDGLVYDDCSQAVILNNIGVPIISMVNNEDIGIFNNQSFKINKIDTFTIAFEDDFCQKLILQTFKNIFLLGFQPRRTVSTTTTRCTALRACQLVSHIQFMSGIEWTKGLNMWPCHVLGHMSILIL
jgi:hypothetical protein